MIKLRQPSVFAGICLLLTACGAPAAPRTVIVTTPPAAATSAASVSATARTTSATPTASPSTATSSSTATAASATASASAASTSASSSAAGGAAALTQRYCTKMQRLCFSYPNGYSVVTTRTSAYGEYSELHDPDGSAVLWVVDGLGGGGGACAQPSTMTVVASTPTAITVPTSPYRVPTVNAVQLVAPSPAGNYGAYVFLSNSADTTKPGTFRACGTYDVNSVNIDSGRQPGFYLGNERQDGHDAPGTAASAEAARAALATPRYALLYAIVRSATLG